MSSTTRLVTHIDGVEIVAREQAMLSHPHPSKGGELVAFRGITKVLLADDRELYLCDGKDDEPCDFHNPNGKSVATHRGNTHNRVKPFGPLTSEDTIRAVLRAVQKAKTEPGRNFNERAVVALNEAGVRSASGHPWSPEMVSNIVNQYKDKYKVRPLGRPRVGNGEDRVAVRAAVVDASADAREDIPLAKRVKALLIMLDHATRLAEELIERVEAGELVDPVLVEKAAKWDQAQSLFGGR